jgi:ubiquitin carboxyl-terminal hydrolase L3
LFNDIIEQAKNMSVEERVDLLENSESLAQVHASAANEGQTEVSKVDICIRRLY